MSIFLCKVTVPPISWVSAASCRLALPPCLLLFSFSAKAQAKGVLEAPARQWNRDERRDGRVGGASPCGTGEVLCWVIPTEPSPVTLMIYHWIIICVHWTYPWAHPVVQDDGGGSCPRELTSGEERWLQAHGWVEIIRGRSSRTVTWPGQPGGEGTDQKKMQKCLWGKGRLGREGWVNYLNANQVLLEGALLFWVSSFPIYIPGERS